MNTILVTAIGSFAADIVIKKLKKEGHTVIGCDIYDKRWLADADNVDCFYQISLVTETNKYIDDIFFICQKHNVKFIFPLTDIEVDALNENRELFAKKGVTICISPSESVKLCRNKLYTYRFLKENNDNNLIPTCLLKEMEIQSVEYPLIVKPYDGRSSQGVRIINDREELDIFCRKNDVAKYIMQPLMEGSIITVDAVRDGRTGKQCIIARKELIRTLNGAGISVRVFKNEQLEEEAMRVAELLNVNGCVNFEYIEDKHGKYYFLECNPRFSGGVEFSCMAGYDCVINHLNCFMGKDIEDKGRITEMYIARKYEEYVTQFVKD